jgi:uncharacterized protein YegL
MSGMTKCGAPPENGAPINYLNAGLNSLISQIKKDEFLRSVCDVALIGFSSYAQLLIDFTTVDRLIIPSLKLDMLYGGTSIGNAIELGIETIEKQLRVYLDNNIHSDLPWLIFITDGHPSDNSHERIINKLHNLIKFNKIICIPIAIGNNADIDTLSEIFMRLPITNINSIDLKEMFQKSFFNLQNRKNTKT